MPLFVIVLLSALISALVTVSKLNRMLPVVLSLKTLFFIAAVKLLLPAEISSGTLEIEV